MPLCSGETYIANAAEGSYPGGRRGIAASLTHAVHRKQRAAVACLTVLSVAKPMLSHQEAVCSCVVISAIIPFTILQQQWHRYAGSGVHSTAVG